MKQTFSFSALHQRMQCHQIIRNFFSQRQVVEVETPMLSPYGVTDKHIDSLITSVAEQKRYLHTSPEFAMKRLIAAGIGDCYQLCKVFRNDIHSRRHRSEFTLLEWYRLGFSLSDLITEVAELVKTLCPDWQDLPVEILSYADAFAPLGINPHQADLPTLKAKTIALSGYAPNLSDDRDEWLDFLLVTKIERQLGIDKLTFLTHYPASQAVLSKKTIDADSNSVALRFELYHQGIELANGFDELTHADEQLARFQKDNQERQSMGKPSMPIDSDFIAALASGLPDCSGVALGIDRLLMLKLGCQSIDEVIYD